MTPVSRELLALISGPMESMGDCRWSIMFIPPSQFRDPPESVRGRTFLSIHRASGIWLGNVGEDGKVEGQKGPVMKTIKEAAEAMANKKAKKDKEKE